jgi:hypothetical protein
VKRLLAFFLFFVFSIAHAQFVELDIQGQKFTKRFDVAYDGVVYNTVPLPAGDWTAVRGNQFTTSGNVSVRFEEIVMSNIENKNLNMSIYIKSKIDSNQAKWTDEPCKINDAIYKNNYGMTLWDQRCTSIRLSQYLQQSDNKVQQVSRDFYSKQGVKHAYNTLQVTFTQYLRSGNYLQVMFYIFPNNYGFENPVSDVLASHPWAPSNYKSDPEKVKFVEQLTAWAENYSNQLYKDFVSGKPLSTEISAFVYSK